MHRSKAAFVLSLAAFSSLLASGRDVAGQSDTRPMTTTSKLQILSQHIEVKDISIDRETEEATITLDDGSAVIITAEDCKEIMENSSTRKMIGGEKAALQVCIDLFHEKFPTIAETLRIPS